MNHLKKFNLVFEAKKKAQLPTEKIDPSKIFDTTTETSKWSESVIDLLDELDAKSCLSWVSEDDYVVATALWDWNTEFNFEEMDKLINEQSEEIEINYSISGTEPDEMGAEFIKNGPYLKNTKCVRSILIKMKLFGEFEEIDELSDFAWAMSDSMENDQIDYFVELVKSYTKLSSVIKRCKSLSSDISIMTKFNTNDNENYFLIVFR